MDVDTFRSLVTGVTKKWTRQRKREERQQSAAWRRRQSLVQSNRTTIRDAAWEVMEDAYLKASANGTLPAHARQIMYAARGAIQEATGMTLDDKYFTQNLLPEYLLNNPRETAEWDVVFDSRGHLHEPHTEIIVPLGTLDVRSYLAEIADHAIDEPTIELARCHRYPTLGPAHRYQAILFIEKEGFLPLFKRVRLAERYDVAIMSTKGLSVTASRMLVDRLCSEHSIPLLVLHDFDKAGFSIVGTLGRSTWRYQFKNQIEVIDLGLRLSDIEKHGLMPESVTYRSDPSDNLLENGATDDEIDFLVGFNDVGNYRGQRVELNAFASDQLVRWIEGKLAHQGIGKLVPDQATLEDAFRRAVRAEYVVDHASEIHRKAIEHANALSLPNDLKDKIVRLLAENPALSWDEAITECVQNPQ